MSHIGPAVVFPLGAPGNVRGVLTVGRRHGAAPFPQAQADVVASFAAQAGVALELAASRAEAERLSLYEDRDRIARDLHDLVIQRLYATGMSLEGTMPMITRPEVGEPDHQRGRRDGRDHQGHPRHHLRAAGPRRRGPAGSARRHRRPGRGDDARCSASRRRCGWARASPRRSAPEVAEQVLAALREALSNAARHAGASRVDVTVDVAPDGILTVQVTDNGTGIAAGDQAQRTAQPGQPSRGARRRTAARAADPTAPAPGTRLEWRVPRR